MTELELTLDWARAFATTLAVELVVASPVLGVRAAPLPRRLALVAFAQLVSHPVLWFVLPSLVTPRLPYLVIAEVWAWLSEAALYAIALPVIGPRHALGVALAANAASFLVGLGLRALGVPV